MHSYEKRIIDAEGNYQIWQLRDDGMERQVAEDHAGYLVWIEEGNELSVIPFVAPPTPDPMDSTKAQLAATDSYMPRITEDLYDKLIAKGVLSPSDFPQAVQDKIAQRKTLRLEIIG